MDESEDELRFYFRDPSSDQDSDSNSNIEDFGAYARVDDPRELTTLVPIFEAYQLQIIMFRLMAAFLHGQDIKQGNSYDCRSTIYGPSSAFQFANLDLTLPLANLIDIYFSQRSVIEEKTALVYGKRATAVDESPLEIGMIPAEKEKIIQEETGELEETEGGIARYRTAEREIIGPATQQASRVSVESLKQVDPSIRDLIVKGKQKLGHSELKAQVSSSTPTSPSVFSMFTGSSTRMYSEGGEIVKSPRERLRARFVYPSQYDKCYLCFNCGTQQSLRFGWEPDEKCMLCSRDTSWGQYKKGTIDWITEKAALRKAISWKVSVLFLPIKSSSFFEMYEAKDGQNLPRALLLKLPNGNILWDCISFIYEDKVIEIAKEGGISAIAISSPARMRNCDRLSYIFNRCPIYLHNRDRGCLPQAVKRKFTKFWEGAKETLWDGVTLIHLGGHFPGSCILHLDRNGGIVFSGNTLKVGADKQTVSVMVDYNFQFPALPKDVLRILHIMEDLEFDELYGDLPGENIVEHAKEKVIFSLRRYLGWIQHSEDSMELEHLSKREIISRGKRKFDDT